MEEAGSNLLVWLDMEERLRDRRKCGKFMYLGEEVQIVYSSEGPHTQPLGLGKLSLCVCLRKHFSTLSLLALGTRYFFVGCFISISGLDLLNCSSTHPICDSGKCVWILTNVPWWVHTSLDEKHSLYLVVVPED